MKQNQQQAIEMRQQGMTYKAIGQKLKITADQVFSLVKPTKEIYRSVKERAGGRCERCGAAIEKGHLHHEGDKIHFLCIPCHRRVHHRITVLYRRSRSQKMTAKKFRSLRHALKLSQKALAEILDINYVTIHRWEKEIVPVPRPVELAMLYLKIMQGKK